MRIPKDFGSHFFKFLCLNFWMVMYEFSNQREKQYYHFGRLHLGIGVAG